MDGLLVVDKPVGPTSHDVVARLRRATGERRIGHTGTLDPAASGVLPLVLGRATRLARFLSSADKRYTGVVRLGIATDTYDAAGQPVGAAFGGPLPDRRTIERVLDSFRGTIEQQPPVYSAKKVAGVRSYRAARRGRDHASGPDRAPRPVMVDVRELSLAEVDGDRLTIDLTCSAGFYVRSLAHDLGVALGTGAHLFALRRTRSGSFGLADAIPLQRAEDDPTALAGALIPPARMLTGFPAAALTDDGVRCARHGQTLGPRQFAATPPDGGNDVIRLLAPSGDLVGIARPGDAPGVLHPVVILM